MRFIARLLLPLAIITAVDAATAQEHVHQRAQALPPAGDMIFGTDSYAVPDLPRPEKANTTTDPHFQQKTVRCTDKSTDGYEGPGIQNEYAKADPENADGTMVILRSNDAHWYLYRIASLQLVREVIFDGNQEPEPRWDRINPNVLYYLRNSELREYNIDSDKSQLVHDFQQEFPAAAIVTTGSEGDASLDRRYWCFMVFDENQKFLGLASFDRQDARVIGIKDSGFDDDINWVGVSMSGRHCIIGWENRNYPSVASLNLQTIRDLPEGANGHGDLALDPGGNDVLVYQNVSKDHICMYDLTTGTETNLLPIPFDVNPDIGLHVSGNCSATPGWALISTYGSKNPPDGSKHSWMDEQLFMLELKPNPRVWRLAFTHAYTSLDFDGEKNYFAECFAAINTAGTRVWFGSNWNIFDTEYSDAYVLQLTQDWYTRTLTSTPGIETPSFDAPLLEAVYPAPATSRVDIAYRLPAREHVRISIIDLLGRERVLVFEGVRDNGRHVSVLDTSTLDPGMYMAVMRSRGRISLARMVVAR